MPLPDSAFAHHPELRALITPPEDSFFRDLDYAEVGRQIHEAGLGMDWFRPEENREALRRALLTGREGQPVWVFAFASLMWDPGIYVDEIRLARAPGHVRDFCLLDRAGRGSPEHPSLMAALDEGDGCTGYALRIPADLVETESRQLFRREMISWGYRTEFIPLETAEGPLEALAFLADHDHPDIVTGLDCETQAAMIAVASGQIGRAADYVENLARHLAEMHVDAPRVNALRDRVRALTAAQDCPEAGKGP